MKKLLIVICLVFVMVFALAGCEVRSVENMIGTTIQLQIDGIDSKKAEREIYDMIRSVESSVSTSLESSLVSQINASKVGDVIELDDTTNTLISSTYEYFTLSQGAFDISIFPLVDLWNFSPNKVSNVSKQAPSNEKILEAKSKVGFDKAFSYDKEKKTITKLIDGAMLDLGAVAKGYIADLANDILSKYRIDKAIIDIGGTLYLAGDKVFKVGIKNPRPRPDNEYIIKVIECKKLAVSTSGDYERYYLDSVTGERYHHIIDPATGRPAKNGIVSVTIVSSSAMLADILSTTIFVMGEDRGIEVLRGIDEVKKAVIMKEIDGKIDIEEYDF